MSAVAFHELGLLGQLLGRAHMRHHQEAGDVHTEFAGVADMLLGDVGLGAMGRYPHRTHAELVGLFEVVDRADPRQQQRRQPSVLELVGDRADPFRVGMDAKAVVEARSRQAVAMAHFDGVDTGGIESRGDSDDGIQSVFVTDGMHTIADRHVLDIELSLGQFGHAASSLPRSSTNRSAVASAADVMMSRLPA